MFTFFLTLSVIQLCLLIILLLNPSVFKKPLAPRSIAIEAALICVFLAGGFQEVLEGTGMYGTPAGWALVGFWSITSLVLAILPEKEKIARQE